MRVLNVCLSSLVVALLLMGGGCAGTVRMYRGPKLPRSEVALVKNPQNLTIIAVDEAFPTRIRPFKRKYASVTAMEFLPGRHEIIVVRDIPKGPYSGVHVIHRVSVRKETLKFIAAPGSTFVIGEDLQTSPKFSWTPWIKEQTSAGLVPVKWEELVEQRLR